LGDGPAYSAAGRIRAQERETTTAAGRRPDGNSGASGDVQAPQCRHFDHDRDPRSEPVFTFGPKILELRSCSRQPCSLGDGRWRTRQPPGLAMAGHVARDRADVGSCCSLLAAFQTGALDSLQALGRRADLVVLRQLSGTFQAHQGRFTLPHYMGGRLNPLEAI
jgi:hypothetical protein